MTAMVTVTASFNYIVNQMVADLGASQSQTDVLRQVPSIGALLVVFLAGAIGDRLGARRVVLSCIALFIVGDLIVAVSPVMPAASFGLLLSYVGKSIVAVVALGYMSAAIGSSDGRAAAFATFAAVMPIAYIVAPVVAGLLVSGPGWRWVPVFWAICGLAGLVVTARMLERDDERSRITGELVTPALAGVVLAAGVQVLTLYSQDGWTSRMTLTVCIGLGAVVALTVLMKRMKDPTLSFAPLRNGGIALLLIVLILAMFANLWFYMTLALQYIYGLDTLETAVAMIPAQLVSMLGAALAGRFIQRAGITAAGTGMLVGVAVCLFASGLLQESSPLLLAILIVSIYAGFAVGAGVAMTNAIMDLSQKGTDGNTAAFRSAASNVGTAIGVAAMTAIVFTAAQDSLIEQSTAAGIPQATATEIATAVRDGATSEDVSSQYSVPVAAVDQISEMETTAYVVGLHAHGFVGAGVNGAAALLFLAVRRRQRQVPSIHGGPSTAAAA